MGVVLFLSGAAYSVGSILGLQREGFTAAVADRNPTAPGCAVADASYAISISDVKAIEDVAKRSNAEMIIAGIEAAVLPAARASVALGLPTIGVEVAQRCIDKGLMRAAWASAGLRQPGFILVDEPSALPAAIETFGLPLVLKPRRSNGSKGVSVVSEQRDIASAIEDATSFSEGFGFIVERFIDGPLLTADGFVGGSKAEVVAFGDAETQAVSRFRVNMSLNYPASYPSDVLEEARALIDGATRALGLKNAPFHCECIVSSDGVYLVELGARSGGSYIGSLIVPAVSGLEAAATFARLQLGMQPDITPRIAGGASLTFLSAPPGRFRDVRGLEAARGLPGVLDMDVSIKPGELGGAVAYDNARHGHVVSVGATREEAVARARAAVSALVWVMDPAVP